LDNVAKFRVTYEIVTPESAEDGEAAESGYASPGGWKHDDPADLTLREAIRVCGFYRGGGGFEDCGSWFVTIDADEDYRTGEHTTYSVHPPDSITPSSYRRLRYLTGRA